MLLWTCLNQECGYVGAPHFQNAGSQTALQRPSVHPYVAGGNPSTPSVSAMNTANVQPSLRPDSRCWVPAGPGSSQPPASWSVTSIHGHLVPGSMLMQAPGASHPVSMLGQGYNFLARPGATGMAPEPFPAGFSPEVRKPLLREPSQRANSVREGYPSGGVPSLLPKFMATLPPGAVPLQWAQPQQSRAGHSPPTNTLRLAQGVADLSFDMSSLSGPAGTRAGVAPSTHPPAATVSRVSYPDWQSAANECQQQETCPLHPCL